MEVGLDRWIGGCEGGIGKYLFVNWCLREEGYVRMILEVKEPKVRYST